jgi:surface protein
MFFGATSFEGDLSSWDVARVESMRLMFFSALNFSGKGLSSWNVRKVHDMFGLFSRADKFVGDLSQWNVSMVEDMSYI